MAQGICSVALPSLNDSQQPKIIAIVVVMMFASTLAVLLRLIARYLSTAKYGYDDLFIVIALVSHFSSPPMHRHRKQSAPRLSWRVQVLTYGLNINELIGSYLSCFPIGVGLPNGIHSRRSLRLWKTSNHAHFVAD